MNNLLLKNFSKTTLNYLKPIRKYTTNNKEITEIKEFNKQEILNEIKTFKKLYIQNTQKNEVSKFYFGLSYIFMASYIIINLPL